VVDFEQILKFVLQTLLVGRASVLKMCPNQEERTCYLIIIASVKNCVVLLDNIDDCKLGTSKIIMAKWSDCSQLSDFLLTLVR